MNAIKWDPTGTLLASCSDDFTAKVNIWMSCEKFNGLAIGISFSCRCFTVMGESGDYCCEKDLGMEGFADLEPETGQMPA